jgi:hypothetical protein
MFMPFHLLKTYIRNHSLFFISFFHSPTYRETTMTTTIRARIYTRGEVSFAKFLFLPSWFAKLLEANFSRFANGNATHLASDGSGQKTCPTAIHMST